MNEEEFEEISRNVTGCNSFKTCSWYCFCKGIEQGFQKGKFEAEKNCGKSINEAIINRRKLDLKEELEFLLIMKEHIDTNNCPLPTLRLNDRIEQLQKEIGGGKTR